MIRVAIIGTGNLARQVFRAIGETTEAAVIQVAGRTPEGLSYFKNAVETAGLNELTPGADLYLLAVSDEAIPAVSAAIGLEGKRVAHCSGTVPMEALSATQRRAVYYPLQTFSQGRELSFRDIPIFVEAESVEDLEFMQRFGGILSDTVIPLSSDRRRELHLAAVFANNFTNYLYSIAWEIASDAGIDPTLLLPLIRETAGKISEMTPKQAQTGPARRGDKHTMQAHQAVLKHAPHQDIYRIISQAIIASYAKEL